ncbi:MAG: hypothetical protein AB1498_05925 [bacterium]
MHPYLKYTLILIFIITPPFKTYAVEFEGGARTYLDIREDAENRKIAPVYQYIDLNIDNIAEKNISFYLGGWARQDLADKSFNDKRFESDLQYGYLSLSDEKRTRRLDVGRLVIFEGVSYERVDGVYGRSNLKYNFSLSAYGGRQAKTNFDESGNYIFGGRVSKDSRGLYNLGVSYLREKDYGADLRDEACADVWYLLLKTVELSGRSVMNLEKSDWKEHACYAVLGPFSKLRVILDSQWINYEYYFLALTSEAFKLQPGIITPGEKVFILGGEAEYPVSGNFLISAGYKNYDYKISGRADYYGGKGRYSVSDRWGIGSDIHRMDSGNDETSYYESRLFAFRNFAKINAVIDLFNVSYDNRINDVKNAYSGTIALGYKLRSNIRLSSDLSYSHNPEFNREIRLLFKFIYGFDFEEGEEKL